MAKIDSIVQVQIDRLTKFPSLAGFGTGAVIADFALDKTTNPLLGSGRYQLYTDIVGLSEDGWLEGDMVYIAAQSYFTQSPNPGIFLVGRKDSGDASWTAALNAIIAVYNDWYGFTIISNNPVDVLAVALWAESQTKVFGYTSSQQGMLGTDDAVTKGFWRTLTPGALAFFQAVDDGEIGVSIDGGSIIAVTGIDFSSTSATSGRWITGDASANLANFLAISDGGFKITQDGGTEYAVSGMDFTVDDVTFDNVAATIEAAIQAADASLSSVTCTYSSATGFFTITSDTTGISSSIELDTPDAGTNLLAASYLNGGAAVDGSAAASAVANYDEIASILQVAVRAADGSLSAVDVEYDSDDGVILFTSDTEGVTSFLVVSAYVGTGTDIYATNYLNKGNSIQGKTAVTAGTDDLATTIKALNYDRTILCYSIGAQDSGLVPSSIEFVWMAMIGEGFPYDPGSQTFAFKQLTGLVASSLSSGQYTTLQNDYVNFMDTIAEIDHIAGGPNGGKVMSGEYIDIIRGTDWLTSEIQKSVFSALINNRKIPMTNAGIAGIKGQVFGPLQLGYKNGLLDVVSPDDVIVPDVLDVPAEDRANRTLPNVTFSARYAGAIHKVEIRGSISI